MHIFYQAKTNREQGSTLTKVTFFAGRPVRPITSKTTGPDPKDSCPDL